ncbi:MAG: protein kinase, partial [Planctomycetales bacterium]|nr:protein kinase [Planctomycetales bacterium]
MPVNCAPTIEAPSGYTLLKRLGAGGYGEVWKATAPGGVEKAVKVVFGHCDEELAGRELKALQRVKSVRHPFLLTIERYEVVNHRLVIVTELADGSLDARFKEAQQQGFPGIPRDELLHYLADAAEALDWLSEQHSLQHLDVKPENLLVLGDHLKVADFGLVKDIASRTLNSLVGGMTPVYSAPEVYDDAPSRRSDQYSLAIVYQQMLTGTLPFPGRTPAQLAKQHMLATPNLGPLSESDRRAIGRALHKKPEARFESCRQLIAALKQQQPPATRSRELAADADPSRQPPKQGDDDTRSSAALFTTHHPAAGPTDPLDSGSVLTGAPLRKRAVSYPRVSEDVVDAPPPPSPLTLVRRPEATLFVGVGGVGLELLSRTRCASAGVQQDESRSAWLAIDTDPDSLKSTATVLSGRLFPSEDLLHVPLRRPKQYCEDSQELLKWLSRRWLYNIPRSLQTRGFRPLGRLALVDHADLVLGAIAKRIAELADVVDAHGAEQKTVRVVILSGASGGTGSGCAIDLGQAVRSAATRLGIQTSVQAVFGCTCIEGHLDTLAAANMYSFLTEFTHAQREGNQGESRPPGSAACFELPNKPFDGASLVSIPGRNDPAKRELVLQSIADFLVLEAGSDLSPLIACVHEEADSADAAIRLDLHSCINLAHAAASLADRSDESLVGGFLANCLANSNDEAELQAPAEFGEFHKSRIARRFLAAFTNARGQQSASASAEQALRWEQQRLSNAAAAINRLADLRRDIAPDCLRDAQNSRRQELFEELQSQICRELALGEDVTNLSLEDCAKRLRAVTSADLEKDFADTASDEAVQNLERGFGRPLHCGCRRLRAIVDPAHNQVDWIERGNERQTIANVLSREAAPAFLVS